MTTVEFYDKDYTPDDVLTYSVISARFNDYWIFVRHHKRSTWEIAGGHIEMGESADDAARRELNEETGATDFNINCIATYSVTIDGKTGWGRLYLAEVRALGQIPDTSEIAESKLAETLPENLTHPDIQPHLFAKTVDYLNLLNRAMRK